MSNSVEKPATLETFKSWVNAMRILGFHDEFILGGSIALKEVYRLYGNDRICHDIDCVYHTTKEQFKTESKMFACLAASSKRDPMYECECYLRADFQIKNYPKANVWIIYDDVDYIEYKGIKVEKPDTILHEKLKYSRPKDEKDILKMILHIIDGCPKASK